MTETLSGHDASVTRNVRGTFDVVVPGYDDVEIPDVERAGIATERMALAFAEEAGRSMTSGIYDRIEELTQDVRRLTRARTDVALVSDPRTRGAILSDAIDAHSTPIGKDEAIQEIAQRLEEVEARLDRLRTLSSAVSVSSRMRRNARRCVAVVADGDDPHVGWGASWEDALNLALGSREIRSPSEPVDESDVFLLNAADFDDEVVRDVDALAGFDQRQRHDAVVREVLASPRAMRHAM